MNEIKYSVVAENISKCYKMYSGPKDKLLDLLSIKSTGKEFYALKNLSFKVEKGDVVGLLGLNGSGKSTLSNILGGVSMPTNGEIQINGEASLIAIGLGLNNFLTGIENIEVKALMMGYKKDEIEAIKQDIIEFAEIGDFINQPIRTYSSGMRSRLGFAISVNMDPDVLVIDEALSVGDPTFTQKCLDKMNEFKARGKTIFFVSHSASQVSKFCNKALWLEYGVLREYGTIEEILPKYQAYIQNINSMTAKEKKEYKKKVLMGQEHSLLKEFKVLDPKFKKVKLKGKIFKCATLINKENAIKIVPYKIDIFTMAFGFIPSIFRKKADTALLILLSQILNFFIISMPYAVITNFIITACWSLFTGKSYANSLIENQFYLDEELWHQRKELDNNEEIQKINRKKAKKVRVTLLAMILSVICITASTITAVGGAIRQYNNPIVCEESFELDGNLMLLIVGKDKSNKKDVLKSVGLVRKEGDKLQMVEYPAELQVDVNGYYYDTIANNYLENDINRIRDILKDNFDVNVSKYIVLNDDYFDSDISTYGSNKDIYYALLNEMVRSDKERVTDIKNHLLEDNPSIDDMFLTSFIDCLTNKGRIEETLVMTSVKYNVSVLKDIVKIDILKKVGMEQFKDVKICYIDKSHIEKNLLIKKIRSKYKYLQNKEEIENMEIEDMIPEVEDDSYLWDTDWWVPESSGSSESEDSNNNSNSNGGNNSSGSNGGSNNGGGNNGGGNNGGTNPTPPPVVEPEPPVVEPEPPVVEPEPEPEPPVVEPEPPIVEPEPPIEPEIPEENPVIP